MPVLSSIKQRHPFILLGLFALALTISGCTMVGPDYVKPSVVEPEKWIASGDPKIGSKEADFDAQTLITLCESWLASTHTKAQVNRS